MKHIRRSMKGKSKWTVTIAASLLLFWLYILIFGFSGQDGEESGNLSLTISEKCVEVINSLAGNPWSGQRMESIALYFEHPLRKLAHFTEYACMGILVYVLWSPWIKKGKGLTALTVAWVFVSAALDEVHQFFVPGRYCSFWDVLLDTWGGFCGVLLCLLLLKVRRYLRRLFPREKKPSGKNPSL